MLNFIENKNQVEAPVERPAESSLSGEELGYFSKLVVRRFIGQVDWDTTTRIYLEGLVDNEDLALIQRGVQAIVKDVTP